MTAEQQETQNEERTRARECAQATLRCMVALSAPQWEQVGILAALYGADSDRPDLEVDDPLLCMHCGTTHPRSVWLLADRSCPFCNRSRLP